MCKNRERMGMFFVWWYYHLVLKQSPWNSRYVCKIYLEKYLYPISLLLPVWMWHHHFQNEWLFQRIKDVEKQEKVEFGIIQSFVKDLTTLKMKIAVEGFFSKYSGLSLSRTRKGPTNLFEIEKVRDRENCRKNRNVY